MLCLLLLAVGLIVWAVVSGTSGDKKNNGAGGSDGRKPPMSITPSAGPAEPPAVTDRPGGTGGDTGNGGTSDGTTAGEGDGGDGDSSPAADSGATEGAGDTGASADSAGAGGSQRAAAALPGCGQGSVKVAVRSASNSYEPGENPRFTLTITNDGGSACKVDLGQVATVLTINGTSDSKRLWSSGDCPTNRAANLVQVPSGGISQRTFEWNRTRTAPGCPAREGRSAKAGAGTYVVEAKVPGLALARVSFVIKSG